jgi:hypothetical protein
MVPHSLIGAYLDGSSQVLWEDGERAFRRGWRPDDSGEQRAILIVLPAADHPFRSSLDRLTHEHELKDELDGAWAARPLELVHDAGRTMLLLEDAGGEPLDRLLGAPMEVGRFLRLAISIAWPSASSTSAASSTRISSQPTFWSTARPARCG